MQRSTSSKLGEVSLTITGEAGEDGKAYEVVVTVRGFRGKGARARGDQILSSAAEAGTAAGMLHQMVDAGLALLTSDK